MGFKCGIVGLPNVGKSTLANALSGTQAAQAANYPFCTIEPNTSLVAVPDARLDTIAAIGKSQKIIPTQLEFVDIAGLVKGASKGEGLGNQFLANIRETDAIIHVVRCFENGDITHVEGSIDPIRDAEIIDTELMLADLESVSKQVEGLAKKLKTNDKDIKAQHEFAVKVKTALEAGKPARSVVCADEDEKRFMRLLQSMTAKPIMYVCNVSEDDAASGNEWTKKVESMAKAQGAGVVVISANIESEIAQLETAEEKKEFFDTIGLTEPGLNKIIRAGYDVLGLQTYFTVGPKEARAWTVRKGAKGPEAAGAIHSDFEKGYIRAEVMSYDDYVTLKSEQAVKEAGKFRSEGKEYLVKDGDIIHFLFNV